jgi:dTDP-4-dehydrorhamnose 3,5-epimerase
LPIELSATSGQALLIPKGFAHGFQALEDDSLLGYLVSSAYSPEHDQGLLWSSATWPLPPTFISERDKKFPSFNEFKTPFLYKTP